MEERILQHVFCQTSLIQICRQAQTVHHDYCLLFFDDFIGRNIDEAADRIGASQKGKDRIEDIKTSRERWIIYRRKIKNAVNQFLYFPYFFMAISVNIRWSVTSCLIFKKIGLVMQNC